MNWARWTEVIQLKSWTGLLLTNWLELKGSRSAFEKATVISFAWIVLIVEKDWWFHDSKKFFCLLSFARHGTSKMFGWSEEGTLPLAKPISPYVVYATIPRNVIHFIIWLFEGRRKGHFPAISRSRNTLCQPRLYPITHIWLKTKGGSRRLRCNCLKAQYEPLYFKLQ